MNFLSTLMRDAGAILIIAGIFISLHGNPNKVTN
jgi:hypothetical protein